MAPALRRAPRLDEPSVAVAPSNDATDIDTDIASDSAEERQFLDWAKVALGPTVVRWFIPQAPFELLLRSAGVEAEGDRRVDFLVAPPWCPPFVVEIDGPQHVDQGLTDEARDGLLAQAGIDVVRVPVDEVRAGEGVKLRRVTDLTRPATPIPSPEPLAWAPVQVHRFALALLEAIQAGFLAGPSWTIRVHDPLRCAPDLIGPYLELLASMDELWGDAGLAPDQVVFICEGDTTAYERRDDLGYDVVTTRAGEIDLVVHLDFDRTPLETLPTTEGAVPQIVVRSCNLPAAVSDVGSEHPQRTPVRTTSTKTRRALQVLLRAVFAKEDFRTGQFEALSEVLAGRDCAVLLPTGAGKSMIYQMAGLCLPGRTLVVDPIVALIEDQAEGLASHGIDRVAAITSDRVAAGDGEALLHAVASADALYVLVSPERLQMQAFRNALTTMATRTPINLTVVDEAHCVSEWGHQFRTSYLTLGATLRNVGMDAMGTPAPLLALTGTASRAVLRDVLFQLGIEQRTERSVVRPASFDRPELGYRIEVTDTARSEATLAGVLHSLPDSFGEHPASFFQSNGPRTYCGLVFCSVVNGPRGIQDTARVVRDVSGRQPGLFSGKAPKGETSFEAKKRANARRFKDNEEPVLVATNAFGMGIDKPNIRWVVHYGLPGSIEGYYQEVGRAGRDGAPATCVLVLTEFDGERSRHLLDDALDLESARGRHAQIGDRWRERDDVTTGLYFQFSSFPGIDDEMEHVAEVVRMLKPGTHAKQVDLPFGGNRTVRERALHRLVVLDVVKDYLVEWGSQQFVVWLKPVTSESIIRALLDFVERSQPGRLETIANAVGRFEGRNDKVIATCARELITFVYDTIELSRRRSLREMYLVATTARSDAEIRRRVLDHLTEGDIAPRLERLVDTSPFSFGAWQEEMTHISSLADAREWRGTTGRLLASYPDHPGLLAGRALAEAFDPEGDLRELASSLNSAVDAAWARYGASERETTELFDWIIRSFDQRRPSVVTAVAGIAQRRGLTTDRLRAALDVAWGEGSEPGLAVLRLASDLDEVTHDLDTLLVRLGGPDDQR